jgi:uncharacterized protein
VAPYNTHMNYVKRSIEKEVMKASRAFAAVLVTGPRRAGKTTLLKKLFPKASYYLLEDPDIISRIRTDPHSFVEEIRTPAILDEIQNVPELFNYIRTLIDNDPGSFGRWYFTGSQDAPLMKGVSESMAGRVAVFSLLPFSGDENKKVSLFNGGFPEVLEKPKTASIWFRSYLQTYLERDVRALSGIKDLSIFRRFLAILASRSGSILNKTDIAAPLGVSVPTITEWINILEVTGQIITVAPFYENFGKRLIKSPKIYFVDSGLVTYLLGIETKEALFRSTFFGSIFEGFVASEVVKSQINRGRHKEIYYFRDQQGLEVDFIIPLGDARLLVAEAKAVHTVKPDMVSSLNRLSKAITKYEVEKLVIYLDPSKKDNKKFYSLTPGVKAIPVSEIETHCR